MYCRFGKRAMDIGLSLVALAALWPLILGLALLVLCYFKESPIFRQVRPGKNGVPFILYKLRSMPSLLDSTGALLPDMYRATWLGTRLRAISLDELPQLWNVLVGDMSLIGPRPLLPEYLSLYDDVQILRHALRPGITGWAQVNGRNALSWEIKFAMDLHYVASCSFFLDCKILLMTLSQVASSSKSECIAAEKFTGTKP